MDLQLGELDLNNIGDWPITTKLAAVVLLGIIIIAGVWWFDTQTQLADLEAIKDKEVALKSEFVDKKQRAKNLPDYQRQLEEMQENFGSMLKQLPDKTEVDSLLIEVSQTGLATGLEPELFRPGEEKQQELFEELPITIRHVGTFHEFGNFISQLASLPRIVTIHDITIVPRNAEKKSDAGEMVLVMDATAKTYRYSAGSAAGGKK